MKKVKDLNPELKQLLYKRAAESDGVKWKVATEETLIQDCFAWCYTPEGHQFWEDVYNGRDVSNHPKYPKSTNDYQIY